MDRKEENITTEVIHTYLNSFLQWMKCCYQTYVVFQGCVDVGELERSHQWHCFQGLKLIAENQKEEMYSPPEQISSGCDSHAKDLS